MATLRRIEEELFRLHLNQGQERVAGFIEAFVSQENRSRKDIYNNFHLESRTGNQDLSTFSEDENLSNVPESEYYLVSQLGSKTYRLQSELSSLYKVIEDSEYLLYLSEDYDSNGSEKPSIVSFHNAILFLVSFANLLYKKRELYLLSPVISAARDGSIELSWRFEDLDVGMLINFSIDGKNNQYYCYRDNRKHQRKGILSEPFDELNKDNEELFFWMKNNLTRFWS